MRLRACRAVTPVLIFALAAAGCAWRKSPKRVPVPAPPPRAVVGPFSLPAKVRVVAFHRLPEHFSTSIPPVWRADGLVLSLVRIAPEGNRVVQYDGAQLHRESAFELELSGDAKAGAQTLSMLDFAIAPQGGKLAVAANDPADNSVKVFVRALAPDAENRLIVAFPGQVDNAGVGWMTESDLLFGLGATRATEGRGASAEFAGLYRLSTETRGDNSQFVLDCKRKTNLSRFVLGTDRRALVSASAGNATFLLDFERLECRPIALPTLAEMRVLGWGPDGDRLLYTTARGSRHSQEPAVLELALSDGRRRLIGAPMASAVYTARGMIAIAGSRSLRPGALKVKPERLVPAQLGIFDQSASETTIYSLGMWTSAPLLAQAAIAYSAPADALAIEIPAPNAKAVLPVVVGFSMARRRVESIASAELDRPLLFSWAPSDSRLAICDCAGEAGSLLIVEPSLD